mmetsp:Transcript_4232/g.12209  ORF Transcript_4232/g.12209 Transcript_4232/m.12209 type:complete len:260 (+) Transcript_4232:630-1409(+)
MSSRWGSIWSSGCIGLRRRLVVVDEVAVATAVGSGGLSCVLLPAVVTEKDAAVAAHVVAAQNPGHHCPAAGALLPLGLLRHPVDCGVRNIAGPRLVCGTIHVRMRQPHAQRTQCPFAVWAVQLGAWVPIGLRRCQQRSGALGVGAEQAQGQDGGLGSQVRHRLELRAGQQVAPVVGLHRPVRARRVGALGQELPSDRHVDVLFETRPAEQVLAGWDLEHALPGHLIFQANRAGVGVIMRISVIDRNSDILNFYFSNFDL